MPGREMELNEEPDVAMDSMELDDPELDADYTQGYGSFDCLSRLRTIPVPPYVEDQGYQRQAVSDAARLDLYTLDS
jgi:hypothetical protein